MGPTVGTREGAYTIPLIWDGCANPTHHFIYSTTPLINLTTHLLTSPLLPLLHSSIGPKTLLGTDTSEDQQ